MVEKSVSIAQKHKIRYTLSEKVDTINLNLSLSVKVNRRLKAVGRCLELH